MRHLHGANHPLPPSDARRKRCRATPRRCVTTFKRPVTGQLQPFDDPAHDQPASQGSGAGSGVSRRHTRTCRRSTSPTRSTVTCRRRRHIPSRRRTRSKPLSSIARSAFARRALAAVTHWYDFDHELAEQQYREAIAAAPNEAGTRNWYAEFLIDMRRFDEAFESAARGGGAEPGLAGAAGQPRQCTALSRPSGGGRPGLPAGARDRAQLRACATPTCPCVCRDESRMPKRSPSSSAPTRTSASTPFSMASLAYGLARAGRRAEAEEMLRDFERRRKAGFYPAFVLAKAHVGLGNVEQALDWLELSVDEKLFGYYLPSVDPTSTASDSCPAAPRPMR